MCFSCKFAGEEAFFAGEFQILFDYDYYDTFVTIMMTTNSNEASAEDLVVPPGLEDNLPPEIDGVEAFDPKDPPISQDLNVKIYVFVE